MLEFTWAMNVAVVGVCVVMSVTSHKSELNPVKHWASANAVPWHECNETRSNA